MSFVATPVTSDHRRSRGYFYPAVAAGLGIAAVWALTLGMCAFYFTVRGNPVGRPNDFLTEAMPALHQLFGGHLLSFFQTAPAYAGSLLVRSPLAVGVMGLHGDWQAVYAVTALPCVAAAPVLGAWLSFSAGRDSRNIWLWLSPFGLLMAINPIFVYALRFGHPEDVLGASLAIAGVIQACRGRANWAMVLLGLAAANKSWALVAVPVAIALQPRIEIRALAIFVATTAVVYLPVFVIQHGQGAAIGASTGSIFMPSQLWWWFGSHFWVAVHAHELIILTAVLLSAWWRLIRARQLGTGRELTREGLILLALIFLLRAAMDPWDNVYYQLPFLMAVYALEVGRAPRLSLALTVLMTLSTAPFHRATLDSLAISYQLAALPLIIWLLLRTFLSPSHWEALMHWSTTRRREAVHNA